ncbi:hypothetical protein DJ79_08760 [Halorubrum ezzemoulense]|uniref:Envelope protein N-terminal domain-containing protein n=1 Tax=Halorubrum ezzemoulense TaxID=337243 RepID=A0A256JFN5_HALEZ|nr:hypothetical protein [Halorubrum ezzemoulense]OYR67570.1 hypothetical protein DJ79_08760 [Halorubrum ezzemoulense]
MKGLGAAGAATVGLSVDNGFAQDAEAIAPLVGVGLAAGAVGVGWALREFEVVGSDPPPEGLTADVLKQQVYQTAKTRQSNDLSTFVDNKNILDGVQHTAYTEAKIAAIEELNAGSSESDVLSAANGAIDSYQTTVERNLLKSWNESAREVISLYNSLDSHADVSVENVMVAIESAKLTDNEFIVNQFYTETNSHTLPDGTMLDLDRFYFEGDVSGGSNARHFGWDPTGKNIKYSDFMEAGRVIVDDPDGSDFATVLPFDDSTRGDPTVEHAGWSGLYDSMTAEFDNVRNGISTWVANVYGDVQSGNIEISDLVTPRERAAMMADGEGTSQAIADLIALNVPVDAEREATITIEDTGATLPGTFALTDSSDGPLEAGTTYDPSTFAGDVYFTADMSLVEGDWSAINTGVDGGTITITSEPYEGTAIEVTTAASETVSVPATDWTDNGDGTWSYDASNDLDTAITNVDTARFVSTATETQYETLQLDGSFTVDKLVNTQSGEEVTTTSFSSSEPQTDSNYITQDEWDQLEQQNKELIEKYENSQSGGGIDLGQFDMFGIPGEIVAVFAAALVALGVLNN